MLTIGFHFKGSVHGRCDSGDCWHGHNAHIELDPETTEHMSKAASEVVRQAGKKICDSYGECLIDTPGQVTITLEIQ